MINIHTSPWYVQFHVLFFTSLYKLTFYMSLNEPILSYDVDSHETKNIFTRVVHIENKALVYLQKKRVKICLVIHAISHQNFTPFVWNNVKASVVKLARKVQIYLRTIYHQLLAEFHRSFMKSLKQFLYSTCFDGVASLLISRNLPSVVLFNTSLIRSFQISGSMSVAVSFPALTSPVE